VAEALGAVVVAGGRGRRFGSDKAAALFLGRPMLAVVLDALSESCDELVVVRAAGQALPSLPGAPEFTLVEDEYEDQGPLAGLITGFGVCQSDLVFATSTDAPLLQPLLIQKLADLAGRHDAVVPMVGGYLQPLSALYRRQSCLSAFEASFARDNRRIVAALEGLDVRTINETDLRTVDPGLLSFHNANTAAELEALERIARS